MMRVVLLLLPAAATAKCATDLDCSLNGVCTTGACACDKPWSGVSCGELKYKVTPASGKNLYNTSDPRNTWNGPIVATPDGKYHLYDPLYNKGSLGNPPSIMHGVADNITGPYVWDRSKDICQHCGENPAFVVFEDPSTKKTVYSLWVGGATWTAGSADGPFTKLEGANPGGGNPAPVYYKGAFYATSQKTTEIQVKPTLDSPWKKFADISHANVPENWMIEDPFMWIDKRDNWHIINHAYNNYEYAQCGNSTASAHFFSADGKKWTTLGTRPYDHTVHYDDGTSHTYTTLERPNLHFDRVTGQLTHINLAADLVTGDEGCAARTKHAHFGHTPCDNCKWDDHAGTTLIALDY
jgi:hypothetical protein